MTLFLEILAAIFYTYLTFIVGVQVGAQIIINRIKGNE